MARREIQRIKSSSNLLKRLTNNPSLPAFVRSLEQPALKMLIQEVGVEDSAALVELTTPKQLATMLDDVAWTSAVPGQPETFDPPEFLRWVEVILEVGEEFCVERLVELGEDFLALAMAHFLGVLDFSVKVLDDHEVVAPASSVEAMEMYGPYQVTARHDDEWDVVRPMLDAFNSHEPDLLQVILARCYPPSSMIEQDASAASHDAIYEHMKKREAQGYITPDGARAFLNFARIETLDSLASQEGYDLESARYFRIASAGRDRTTVHRPNPEDTNSPVMAESDDAMQELQELTDAVMRNASEPEPPQLFLTGPSDTTPSSDTLKGLLNGLASTNQPKYDKSLTEVAYLSNVLMAGYALDSKRFGEADALEVVLATCNLGLDYLDEDNVDHDAGMVRLFRIGWNLLQSISGQAARQLVSLIESTQVDGHPRAWILGEVAMNVCAPEFLADVEAASYAEAQQTLQLLSLVLEENEFFAIEGLINDVPRLFSHSERKDDEVSKHYKLVSCLDDFEDIDAVYSAAAAWLNRSE